MSEQIDELIADRDALQAQVRQLQGDLKGARTSRDTWRERARKAERAVGKYKEQLKAERELARMWPRFSDGTPVRVGDSMMYDERAERVQGIRFYRNAVVFEFAEGRHCRITHGFAIGQPVDRPPLNAADGQPIEPGTMLYGGDGSAWVVESIAHGEKYPIEGSCDGEYKQLKPEWLTHEKPDSCERIVNTDLARDLKAAEEERDQWRALCGELMDAADEIRRIAATKMPSGGLSVVDGKGKVVG
ncbi:MAG: hypothetical protein IJ087_01470 [Eggerthellaceae bacterium]|nr:hypothetical protein [Eggerthellaceae bacterium]